VASGTGPALAPLTVSANYIARIGAEIGRAGGGTIVFDHYAPTDYKFVRLTADGRIEIGHVSGRRGLVVDASASAGLTGTAAFANVEVSLFAGTVDVRVDGRAVLARSYNGVTVDGRLGLLGEPGAAYASAGVSTNDPAYGVAITAARAGSGGGETLTEVHLDAVREAAIARVTDLYGLSDADVATLRSVELMVTNLAGLSLARALDDAIVLDVDAAGHGWFVDMTPLEDGEFAGGTGPLGIDLLSVLAHEYAHILGRDHGDDPLTVEAIEAGDRLLLADTETVAVEEPVIEATTALRPTLDQIVGAIRSSEIQITVSTGRGKTKAAAGATYVYDEDAGRFELAETAVVDGQPDGARWTLLDADGALFAYVDAAGALWTIDDLDQRPGGHADDAADDWIWRGSV
jgi:hypothetical protein